MPDWLEPMAATLTQERFSGGDWLFERKFDGIRLLAYKRGDEVRLYSRNRLPQNLPPLAAAVARLPVDEIILDGEVTWDGQGAYDVFDILWLNGHNVTSLPLEQPVGATEPLLCERGGHRLEPVRHVGCGGHLLRREYRRSLRFLLSQATPLDLARGALSLSKGGATKTRSSH